MTVRAKPSAGHGGILARVAAMTLAPEDHAWGVELRAALAAGEIRPWYQPQVRIETGELVGFEALARWHRPSGVVDLPGSFVVDAEAHGLLDLVDLAVMRQAVADVRRWRDRRPGLRLGVNCGAWLADDPDGVDRVLAECAGDADEAAGLAVEITETTRPRGVQALGDAVARLRGRGVEVWFDDFGTGWAELVHVVEVPVSGIKIDRYFTERLDGDGGVVVRALLDVADTLGLQTLIEGVSTPGQARLAADLGCREAQGFLWSPPVPAADVEPLLALPRLPFAR